MPFLGLLLALIIAAALVSAALVEYGLPRAEVGTGLFVYAVIVPFGGLFFWLRFADLNDDPPKTF